MTSRTNELPPGAAAPDFILLALFQSRLRERSLHLRQEIDTQRLQLSADAESGLAGDDEEARARAAQLRAAEQSLVAVQQAQERLSRGHYGLCDDCREPINWDELLELPEQTLCSGCSQFRARKGLRLRS